MMAPPGILSPLVLLIAIYLSPCTAAQKEQNSLTDDSTSGCKGGTLKFCAECEAQLGLSLKTCCDDSGIMSRCQHEMRKKRDVDNFQSSESEELYNALTNPQIVARSRPFLGKRSDNAALIHYLMQEENRKRGGPVYRKKARPFLGKRSGEFNNDDEFVDEFDEEKRARPFLGKRTRPFLGKRARPFLGKRDYFNDEMISNLEQRARPFLGKRGGSRPFLGKRASDDGLFNAMDDFEEQQRYMLGQHEYDNDRYSLGKRSVDDVSEEESK